MDCKIPGRKSLPVGPKPEISLVTYGLDGLTPGQAKFAHQRANAFLQRVMMDATAPGLLKDLIRDNNAVGLMLLQDLLAAYHRHEADSVHD